MVRKKNKILLEWFASKDAGERNCANMKHIAGHMESITVRGTWSSSIMTLQSNRDWRAGVDNVQKVTEYDGESLLAGVGHQLIPFSI